MPLHPDHQNTNYIKNLILQTRCNRRFDSGKKISSDTLLDLLGHARLSSSSRNLQPLRYIISNEPEKNEIIFSCLKWAGYLEGWRGPEPEERPSAYIVVLGDKGITDEFGYDAGIASQSIRLAATSIGLRSCVLGSTDAEKLTTELRVPSKYKVLLTLVFGYPKEEVVIEELPPDGSIRYWHDDQGIHHVPKRGIEEIVLNY